MHAGILQQNVVRTQWHCLPLCVLLSESSTATNALVFLVDTYGGRSSTRSIRATGRQEITLIGIDHSLRWSAVMDIGILDAQNRNPGRLHNEFEKSSHQFL